MSDDIKPEVIKRTQDSLGKYIKRPPLTEKLLRKPPFRFLHDIVTAVIKETGFLRGVFSAAELNHENIKDRDSKIAFLQKLIDAIKTITETNLTVRPTKIVAGHEPTKTNELLQTIGKALDKQISSAEYVNSLKKDGKKAKTNSKTSTKENTSTAAVKPAANTKNQSQDRRTRIQSQDRAKGKETEKKKSSKTVDSTKTKGESPRASGAVVENEKEKEEKKDVKEQEAKSVPIEQVQETAPTQEKVSEPEPRRPHSARINHHKPSAVTSVADVKHMPMDKVLPKAAEEPQAAEDPQVFGSSVEVKASEASNMNEVSVPMSSAPLPQTAINPPSARQTGLRPTTARPTSARPPSARPAAPRIRDRGEIRIAEEISNSPVRNVNVITENIKEAEEDDNYIIMESQSSILVEEQPPSPVTDVKPIEDNGEHGHLVAQILETQKELEDHTHDNQQKKVEIEWEVGHQRERELVSREVEKLCSSIQTLTRAANPLGKLMDFLQEDVDSMQRELELWQHTNVELLSQLRAENSLTQESTEPMKQHLQELESKVEEELNQLSTLKATVLRNDQRIHKLLTNT